jgi:hypothetical protein
MAWGSVAKGEDRRRANRQKPQGLELNWRWASGMRTAQWDRLWQRIWADVAPLLTPYEALPTPESDANEETDPDGGRYDGKV